MTYTSDESGRREVYLVPFGGAGAKWQISAAGGAGGTWRADGKEITYTTPEGKIMAVPIDVSGAAPVIGTPAALIDISSVSAGDMSPDGQRFYLAMKPPASRAAALNLITNWPALLKK